MVEPARPEGEQRALTAALCATGNRVWCVGDHVCKIMLTARRRAPKVTTLNDVNFDDYIAAKDFTMVEFFLPTCKVRPPARLHSQTVRSWPQLTPRLAELVFAALRIVLAHLQPHRDHRRARTPGCPSGCNFADADRFPSVSHALFCLALNLCRPFAVCTRELRQGPECAPADAGGDGPED